MEQNIAILMADLSGYTALTETHGASSAADLIDTFISIAEKCLIGDSRLHERTGDEIMIVSASADCLLATAMMIGSHASKQEHFLQLHGGLHYGKVLQRNNHFFGSTINITSRIAAKACAGSFWCSSAFANALSGKYNYHLKSKGNHSFKNIDKEKEIFELVNEESIQPYIDPVCRMLILDPKKAIAHSDDPGIYFCSAHCSETYSNNHLK
jgi:adenylate cyclase